MPNYQPLVNEEFTYTTLQNVPYTEDAGCFDLVCGLNTIIAGDNVLREITMADSNLGLEIIEQPANTFRYRYKSEKGSHGGIKGENATRSKKSFPIVKVQNCPPNLRKKVLVKVSLYTNEDNPKPHVYELTGKNADGAKLDESFLAKFQSLAITTRKKEEVLDILKERKKADYDSIGFSCNEASVEAEALEEMKSMNLDSARLCFEVFSADDRSTPLSDKIFSNCINNQKSAATGDLKIVRLSHFSGYCTGGEQVMLLCEKVKKEDIKVRFFEQESDWEAYGEWSLADVHHQVAIVFKTPPYHQNVNKEVWIQLIRPSDSACSEPHKFEYKVDDAHPSFKKVHSHQTASVLKKEPAEIPRKRKRLNLDEGIDLAENLFKNSSGSYSPSSTNEDPLDPFLINMDLGSNLNLNLEQFFEFVEVLNDDQISNVPLQSGELCSYDPISPETNQVYPQRYTSFVEIDGLNEITNSFSNSMSLADQCCKQEPEYSKIQKASNDLVIGLKSILESREQRTYLHYATHLIPLQDEDGNNMLHLGIKEQSENWNFILKMVKIASEDSINHQNKIKESPLHLAVKGNHVNILLLLLARGGDPNSTDRNGNNCLHLAAKYGYINCLKLLMPPSTNRKIWKHTIRDIDILNYDGMSPLHLAVTGNFKDCVEFLLNSEADVNLSEKKCGRSSLHLSIEYPSVLQIILKRPDLDVYAEDFRGYTAVQLACFKRGKPFEAVSAELKDEREEIIKFFEFLNYDEEGCDSVSSEAESDGESSDSSEFEDAVEDFGSISSSGVAISTSEPKCRNENKSNLMKIEEELHRYLDRDDNWKKLADLIGLDTRHVALLDQGLSPGQTVLRKIKDLYHPCQLQTVIDVLQVVGLEEGVQILQRNS